MSIGWGFAAGIGQGAYSVADDRIKDGMLQRRELRAREAQMELEQYRTETRREDTKEERSYLEGQRPYLEGREEAAHKRGLEAQAKKDAAAMARTQVSAGKTGAGKGFKAIVAQDESGNERLFSHNLETGEITPYQSAGGGQISEADLNARADEWASVKFGKWASKDDMKAAAKEIGYDGPLSREALKFAYKEFYRSGGQPSAPQAAQPKASATKAKEAADLRKRFEKNPTQYPAYLEEQGFSPEEVETRAEKRGLIKRDGKWVVAEKAKKTSVSDRFRSSEGKEAVSNRERIAQSWAENLTEESAKKQFATGPEMNKFLRKKKYLEYLTPKQKKAVFYIMRQLPKPD